MNVANALQWLGTLYRNPADAIKEHISNAVDEHVKALQEGTARTRCTVVFRIQRREIAIEYPYGMTLEEFESALQRVAESAKKRSDVAQIGQLGIGIFSFQQIGRKCTFFSLKDESSPTVRVVLREGRDDAEFDPALKRESLAEPGMKIVISELKSDPTKPRGSLAPEKLTRLFADKFEAYLRKGWLAIEVWLGPKKFVVEPPKIDLPRIGQGFEQLELPGYPQRVARLAFYFDPSGRGAVSIRHSGVVVVEDLAKIEAYGLEETVYGSGSVKGWVDADFLRPLPARTAFEETPDWLALLEMLHELRPQIQAEVEELKAQEQEKTLSEVQRRAVQLAREILDLDDFRDLELPGGLAKARAAAERSGAAPTGERTGARSRDPGDHPEVQSPRIGYEEIPFPDGAKRHSKYVTGKVLANTLHPDYQQERGGSPEAKLAYATLLIGKEAIGFNDKTGAADEQLEKLLSFHFRLRNRLGLHALPGPPKMTKIRRGRGK